MYLRKSQAGFSLLEIMAVVAVILIIAALGIPQIIGLRNKAKNRSCDALYHELDSEIANALDNLIWSSTEVISIVLNNHENEKNPRTKSQYGYVTNDTDVSPQPKQFVGGEPDSCQVQLASSGPLTLVIAQARTPAETGPAKRSFRIGITE